MTTIPKALDAAVAAYERAFNTSPIWTQEQRRAAMIDALAAADAAVAPPAPAMRGGTPITKEDLADALDCFWNAAIGEAHDRQAGMDVASIFASGVNAVSIRLKERAAEDQPPIVAPVPPADPIKEQMDWCFDMERAPRDGSPVLFCWSQLPEMGIRCRHWETEPYGHWRGQDVDTADRWAPAPRHPAHTPSQEPVT